MYCSRAGICARCRKCWVMPAFPPPRFTRTWISSIWPRCMMPPTREQGRNKSDRNQVGVFQREPFHAGPSEVDLNLAVFPAFAGKDDAFPELGMKNTGPDSPWRMLFLEMNF